MFLLIEDLHFDANIFTLIMSTLPSRVSRKNNKVKPSTNNTDVSMTDLAEIMQSMFAELENKMIERIIQPLMLKLIPYDASSVIKLQLFLPISS